MKKWFKRVLVAISCATLGATLAFGFASCKDEEESSSNQPAACTHVWNDGTVKTAATCTVDGTMLYTCTKCGETKTDKIASGHKYQTTVVEATCFSDGYTLNVCSACGSTKKTNVTAGQHNYVKTTTEATCLSDGATSFTCSGCGDSYRDVTERATGHNTTGCKWESSNEQVGTCTWQVVETTTCKDCDEPVTVIVSEYVKHENTFVTTTPATCTAAGVKAIQCNDCNTTVTEEIAINVNAHNWQVSSVTGGLTSYSCQHMGCTETKTVFSAKDQVSATVPSAAIQEAGEVELQNAAIKMDEAVKNQLGSADINLSVEEADVADIIDNETANKLGNSPVYNFSMSNASGAITNFSGKLTVTVPYSLESGADPDEVCIWYIDDQGKVTAMPATYSEVNGEGFATFETDHFSYYTVIRLTAAERCAAYGHTYTSTVVAPACNQEGYTVKSCVVCKKVEPRTDFTAALSHNYASAVVAPTCTEMGYTVFTCSLCNDKYISNYTAKVAHNYESKVTAPTCTANGYTTYTCTACNTSYTDGETAATGHSYKDGTCSVCGRKDPNAASANFYWNMVESLTLANTYYVEVSGLTVEMVNSYSNGDKQDIVYKVSLAQMQIGFDETGIVGKGEGSMVATNVETGKSPATENASGAMKVIFRDGKVYAYMKSTETLGASYEQFAVASQSEMFGVDEEEMPAMMQMMTASLTDLGNLLSGLGAGENSRLNSVLQTIIEYCFTKTTTDDGFAFTLNADRALEMYNAVKDNTVDKLFDMVFGEGAFAATQTYLVNSVDKTVSQFEAEAKTELGKWGISIDVLYNFVNKYVEMMMGSMGGGSSSEVKPMSASEASEEFDIKAMIAEMGNMKISEILDEMTGGGVDYKEMINQGADMLKEMKVFELAELDETDLAGVQTYVEDIAKALRNNPITFTTDKSGALLSLGATLKDFKPIDNSGKTLGKDGIYLIYDVTVNGAVKFVLDGTYAGAYEDVIAKAEAAKSAYEFKSNVETDNYDIYVDDEGNAYLWYHTSKESDPYYDKEYYLSRYTAENVIGTETYQGKLCTKYKLRLTNVYTLRDSSSFTASTDCHGWLTSENYWRGYYGYVEAWIDEAGNVVGVDKDTFTLQDWNTGNYFEVTYNTVTGEYASSTQHSYKLVATEKGEGCASTYNVYECSVCGARTAEYVDGGHNTQSYCELVPGATSCEDGVYRYYKCVDCDRVTSYYTSYYHSTFQKEYVIKNVSEECGDMKVVWYECACGQVKDVNTWQINEQNGAHYFYNTDTDWKVDTTTHRNYVDTYTCSLELCQYKYTREYDWHYSYDGTEEGCQVWSTYTYRFYDASGNLVLTLEDVQEAYNSHHYESHSSEEYSNQYGTGTEGKWVCQYCNTVRSHYRYTYDQYGRETSYEDLKNNYGYYRVYGDYCTYTQYDLYTGEYETSGTSHAMEYLGGWNYDSCTQYYYEGQRCRACGYEDGYYRAPDEYWGWKDGHNWEYDYKLGHYRCWRCGTESSTGSDAILSLEDMAEDGVIKVGYYNFREWRAFNGQDSLVLVDIVVNYDYNSSERITISAENLFTKVVTSPENGWVGDHYYEHNRESGIVTVNMDVLAECLANLNVDVETISVIFSVQEKTIMEDGTETWLEIALTFDYADFAK